MSDAAESFDLIVLGAGISGIAAARTAQGFGARVLVLEAQPRVGGRTFTDTASFAEIGFDTGAQYFQQVLSGNEVLQIAQARGCDTQVAVGNGGPAEVVFLGSEPASKVEQYAFEATMLAVKGAIMEKGAEANGDPWKDQSIERTISHLAWMPYYRLAVAQAVDEFVGSVRASTIDLYNYLLLSPLSFVLEGDDYLLRSGVGAFVASLADGLDVRVNAPATSVVVDASGVTVTAAGERFSSTTVIVTASTAVLLATDDQRIAFDPPLPPEYVEALRALPLSHCYKALLGIDPAFAFQHLDKRFSIVLPLTNTETPTFFPYFWNTHTVELIASGAYAGELEAGGVAYARAKLLEALDRTFPGAKNAWDGRESHSSWSTNPYTRGAYSAALPGQVGARTLLAKPIGRQLWFAGEAVGVGGARGCLQGAYRAGVNAAHGAVVAMRGAAAAPRYDAASRSGVTA